MMEQLRWGVRPFESPLSFEEEHRPDITFNEPFALGLRIALYSLASPPVDALTDQP